MIAAGQVEVNGARAVPGQEVDPGVDVVTVNGARVRPVTGSTYLLLNKPLGVVSSVGDPRGRPSVTDNVPEGSARVYPVGRLDLDSRGLILLTDDGELADRLMHPRYDVEKEYIVVISGHPKSEALVQLREGIVVRGETFSPVEVRVLETIGERSRVAMVLREGKKREIRRLWKALGHRVLDLQRIRLDGLSLGDLAEGGLRALNLDEIQRLRAGAGLK